MPGGPRRCHIGLCTGMVRTVLCRSGPLRPGERVGAPGTAVCGDPTRPLPPHTLGRAPSCCLAASLQRLQPPAQVKRRCRFMGGSSVGCGGGWWGAALCSGGGLERQAVACGQQCEAGGVICCGVSLLCPGARLLGRPIPRGSAEGLRLPTPTPAWSGAGSGRGSWTGTVRLCLCSVGSRWCHPPRPQRPCGTGTALALPRARWSRGCTPVSPPPPRLCPRSAR